MGVDRQAEMIARRLREKGEGGEPGRWVTDGDRHFFIMDKRGSAPGGHPKVELAGDTFVKHPGSVWPLHVTAEKDGVHYTTTNPGAMQTAGVVPHDKWADEANQKGVRLVTDKGAVDKARLMLGSSQRQYLTRMGIPAGGALGGVAKK